MILSACSNSTSIPNVNAACDGLRGPFNAHIENIVREQENTPDSIIESGAKLASAYSAGCG